MRIRQTRVFARWLSDLRDVQVRAAILRRIARMANGNFGDAQPVGRGVSELRIHLGAGWRLYYVQRGGELVILLCGGSKGTQTRDIERAHALATDPELDVEVDDHEP